MARITEANSYVTQVNLVEVDPENQAELCALMQQQASEVMTKLPGFVSINLHQSLDGTRLVNYVQWQTKELLDAAHEDPEFKLFFDRYHPLQKQAGPKLYRVVYSKSQDSLE